MATLHYNTSTQALVDRTILYIYFRTVGSQDCKINDFLEIAFEQVHFTTTRKNNPTDALLKAGIQRTQENVLLRNKCHTTVGHEAANYNYPPALHQHCTLFVIVKHTTFEHNVS